MNSQHTQSLYQFTTLLILLGIKKIQLLKIQLQLYDVSHSYSNAGEVPGGTNK